MASTLPSPGNLSTLIATFFSNSTLASEAFRHPPNIKFIFGREVDAIGKRENTPVAEVSEAHIYLSTEHRPYDPVAGFVFGSQDDESVDILLDPRRVRGGSGVSRMHFSLIWNWERGSGFVIKNHSQHGTKVVTEGQVRTLAKDNSYFLSDGDIIIAGFAQIRVAYPVDRGGDLHIFQENWRKIREEFNAATTRVPVRGITGLEVTDIAYTTQYPTGVLMRQKIVGQSVNATVWKATDIVGRVYAVKELRSHARTQSEQVEGLKSEDRTMSQLHHPHILKCYPELEVIVNHPHVIVLEYARYGSLYNHRLTLSASDVEVVFTQLLSALQYSHDRGIAHRDIKPANVLIESIEPLVVKLADFGFAQWGPWTGTMGTRSYIAPEMVRYPNVQYTVKVDIWSLGMMLLEFATFVELPQPPAFRPNLVPPARQSSLAWERFFNELRTAPPRVGRQHLADFAKRMLVDDENSRPAAESCIAFVEEHRARLIEAWIRIDNRRASPINFCISALLDYNRVEYETRRQVLQELARRVGSFQILYTEKSQYEPGLYVPGEMALDVVQAHLPGYVKALRSVINRLKK